MDSKNYVIRVLADPSQIDPGAWNELLSMQPEPTLFMRHEYLAALVRTGCACADTGWAPSFVTVWHGDHLQAACAAWVKTHSYGEYVFDWAWAEAYQRHGLHYYPKLLIAVPFTPVPGTRLMAVDAPARNALIEALRGLAQQAGLSSIHTLFAPAPEAHITQSQGWLQRQTVQFHWQNRTPQSYADFADFLAAMSHDKRKKISQERRRVAEAGVSFTVLHGKQIAAQDWVFFHACYTLTYRAHGSSPYLNLAFFQAMQRTMPEHWLMFVAYRGGEPVAVSLLAIDPQRRVAYGRYWGCTEPIALLHFEACYYQPLQWCINNDYRQFEGGAQGEHKLARGLLPVVSHSTHWLQHPGFYDAVARHLEREGPGMQSYVDELREHSPFKA